ncbi:MAG: BamA/TamA family outer membrane protein [Spirosomataceae bacterium]
MRNNIQKIICKHVFLSLAGLFFWSGCTRQIQMEEGEFLLKKQRFEGNKFVSSDELQGLIPLAQKPNTRPLSFLNLPFTPKIWYLNFGKNTFNRSKQEVQKERIQFELNGMIETVFRSPTQNRRYQKLTRKLTRIEENLAVGSSALWRSLGEEPSILRTEEVAETAKKIQKYLQEKGFRDAVVNYQIDTIQTSLAKNTVRKANLIYQISEDLPYLIDSVIYTSQDSSLLSIILQSTTAAQIKPGDRMDKSLVEEEKIRLELLAKNEGYYNFLSKFIRSYTTNSSGDFEEFRRTKRGNLFFEINLPPQKIKHTKYKLKEVVFKGFDNSLLDKSSKPDTVFLHGIQYITLEKRIPIQYIDRRILTRPNTVYKAQNILETQRQLGFLNQFQFAGTLFQELDSTNLKLEYFSPSIDRFTLNANLGPNNIQNIWGGGLTSALVMRNTLRRLETIEFGGRFSLEGQPALLDRPGFQRSIETGANIGISFPTLLLPPSLSLKAVQKNPSTKFGVGINYSVPIWGERLNFKLNSSYSFQPTRFSSVSFSLLDLSLVNTNYFTEREEGLQFYTSLLQLQAEGNNLKITFDPQFVSSFNATYQFNNQNLQKPYSSSRFFRVFLESGGTFLNVIGNNSKLALVENLFPIRNNNQASDSSRAYFQFVKVNLDFRKYLNLTAKSSWAYRVNIGVTNPYGRNRALPYEKNFFAGGSNSLRAWSPRSLGVGSAPADITEIGNVIPQPGDILLEGSVEYRRRIGKLFGDVQMATFLDAGNIWKWYPVPTKMGQAEFDFRRFYKEIALGTGIGFRLDFTYFLFRLDVGIKVFDPAQPAGKRFVLDDFQFGFNNRYGILPQIGIGYPF